LLTAELTFCQLTVVQARIQYNVDGSMSVAGTGEGGMEVSQGWVRMSMLMWYF